MYPERGEAASLQYIEVCGPVATVSTGVGELCRFNSEATHRTHEKEQSDFTRGTET